ncbi:MAG: FHA domain-containing protein [Verrucomicrobiales bacterium]|nr:FHA domain-containing protein [Verrucomicrobiales bacterium]
MAKVTIYVPEEAPVKYGLGEEAEITVGRAEDNDIVIEHESISSHHAKFAQVGDQTHLIDLDSTNGTFADGVEAANTPLHNGMRIIFGEVEADFECEDLEGAGDDEAEGGESADEEHFEAGEAMGSSIHAEIASQSVRPAGFKNLSPIEVVEKKDSVGQIAMLLGVVGIIAAIGLAAVSFLLI